MKSPTRKSGVRQFALLPVDLLMDKSVTTLSHADFRVMVLLAGQYRGHNNGALGLTAEQARRAGIGSDNTLYRALKELAERGLIEQVHPASRVPPRPAMYAISWKPVDETRYTTAARTPSFSYRTWTPPKSDFRPAPSAVKAQH